MDSRILRRPEPLRAAALALALCACGEPAGSGSSDTPSPGDLAPRFADVLARADADVAKRQAAVAGSGGDWTAYERLALALLERARLGGRFEDYAGAANAAATVERLGGPHAACATRVRIALAVHRLAAAETALAACERALTPASPVELVALRADLAFHSGRYRDALNLARGVLEQRESPQDLARLALARGATGSPTEALALLDRAEARDHAGTPALRAWLSLQRGLVALQRGRWEEALAQYLAAQRHLEGWWLVDEHIAEVRALLGQTAEAAAIYERVLGLHPNAELMDAYARLLQATGRPQDAASWASRARTEHQRRSELLFEAAEGHALAHALAFDPRAATTLQLARRVAAARPTGPARLALARALLAAGHPRDAVAVLREAGESGWEVAELHAVAWHALREAGLHDAAATQAALAQAMNPRWRAQFGP